ncbi:hypothetical protein AB6D86_23490 [Vibrio splendidus]
MFIMPEGCFGIDSNFVSLMNVVPLDENSVDAWLGGEEKRKSIFDHYNLFEDDGSHICIRKHVPRHNINTFLAIAGITDHVQAILMGRIDITQNKHYQHQAESQSYLTASLAVTSLEKAYDDSKNSLIEDEQLALFDRDGEPVPHPKLRVSEPPKTEVSRRIAALAHSVKRKKNTGVSSVKASALILVDPKLSMEHNLKQNLQTYGETTSEVTHYFEGGMSDNFLPDLKIAHDKLLKQNLTNEAKKLLERHAKLHPLGFGACTRDVGRWGCPYAMKCQSGLPCGYFTLTGRMGEMNEVSCRLKAKRMEVSTLRKIQKETPYFKLALREQEEAVIVLEALEEKAIDSLNTKKLVSLLAKDLDNPLGKIIERMNEQMLIGKTPKTLADLFFIEQKRSARNTAKDKTNNG